MLWQLVFINCGNLYLNNNLYNESRAINVNLLAPIRFVFYNGVHKIFYGTEIGKWNSDLVLIYITEK